MLKVNTYYRRDIVLTEIISIGNTFARFYRLKSFKFYAPCFFIVGWDTSIYYNGELKLWSQLCHPSLSSFYVIAWLTLLTQPYNRELWKSTSFHGSSRKTNNLLTWCHSRGLAVKIWRKTAHKLESSVTWSVTYGGTWIGWIMHKN